jgi:hypothetical protein
MTLTSVLIGFAALGAFRLHRLRHRPGALILLAIGPFAVVGMQAYGGEAILRSYLFGLPFFALLAAAAFTTRRPGTDPLSCGTGPLSSGIGLLPVAALWIVSSLLGSAAFLARYGNERFERVSTGEIHAIAWIYSQARPHATLAAGVSFVPWRYRQWETYSYMPAGDGSALIDADAIAHVLNASTTPGYFMLSPQQGQFGEEILGLPGGWERRLLARLKTDSRFREIFSSEENYVFVAR